MTKTHGPIRRYLCGGTYVAAGLAMAISGAIGLYGSHPGALLELPGGLVVAVLGGAVIRECRRQSRLDVTAGTPVPAGERPPTRIPRLASSEGGVRLSLPHPGRPRLPPSLSPNPPSA